MDIIYVIWQLYSNGKIAVSRGHKPMKYRLITAGLCFGLEILGSLAGLMITLTMNSESRSLKWVYMLSLLGIVIGSVWSRLIVCKAPVADRNIPYRNDAHCGETCEEIYRRTGTCSYGTEGEQLTNPARIHVVNEYFWNDDAKELLFLNNIPICTLESGKECTFLSTSVKNIFSIGRPDYPADDTQHSIKFVAAENGNVEIVIKDGKIVTDRFKNLKAK